MLVANLGTPDAPTSRAVRRYLREFLSDRRVIELPRLLWWPILYGFILPFRPRRSAGAYRKIWSDDGSPLLANSVALRDAVKVRLTKQLGESVSVELGMRYGNPSIDRALDRLDRQGCDKLVVLPLYPQFSATTTGSTFDAVAHTLRGWRYVPELSFINDYYQNADYIRALAASVREFRTDNGSGGELLLSFHGLPQSYVDAGDPYHDQCMRTAKLLAAELGLGDDDWRISFQSRLGAAAWLRPYTDEVVRDWGRQGVKTVDVICPGFPADCLETLEEIAIRNDGYFRDAGGQLLRYIPALNTRADHVELLADLITSKVGAGKGANESL